MKKLMIWGIPAFIALMTLGILVFSGVVMFLWNNILTAVLHVGAITLWQAAGILLLSKILFGGFKGRHHRWSGQWKKRMQMKWHNSSPEEKEKMRQSGCYGRYYGNRNAFEVTDQPAA